MKKEIIALIEEKGPLTGADLWQSTNFDPLLLWRLCRISEEISIRIVGTRYLRLDRRVDGFARLSPSFLREFLTYSIIGLSNDLLPIEEKASSILAHIEGVSRTKSELAYNIISALAGQLGNDNLLKNHACFIIAGDIVFNMAHDVPRPERSTGKMVKGSDMDIVVIVDDKFPERLMKRLDEEIYREKYRLLINPHLMEEIDYIVKTLDRVRTQMKFDTFKHMVACKILHEGTLLYGNDEIFHTVKAMLIENGVTEKLSVMEGHARVFRKRAEDYLMSGDPEKIKEESLNLFYPTEESEEFE